MNIQDEILESFASGDFSPSDAKRVDELFNDREHLKTLEAALRRQWDTQEDECDRDLSHILHALHYRINTEAGKVRVRWRRRVIRWGIEMATAAVVAAAIAISVLWVMSDTQTVVASAELQAPRNARVQFTLPDGTTGWLNSGATLKYPLDFTEKREVELSGEGFFDVTKKDNAQPFTVLANGGRVMVWGTRFDVNADHSGRTAEVVLEEGKVEFIYRNKSSRCSVMMNPGEKLVYDNEQQQHTVTQTNPSDYIQWINGRFVVRGESIAAFAAQFGRRFNMDVVVADPRLKEVLFRATFEDESPEEILRLLDLITPISYTVHERQLLADGTFSRKKVVIGYCNKRLRETDGIYE